MNLQRLFEKAVSNEYLTHDEGLQLYHQAGIAELMTVADIIRYRIHPENKVSWIIDRNVNISNICVAGCKFCNFHRTAKQADSYITCMDDYRLKIKEMQALGGNQLLLQGGLHPTLGIQFYIDLFRSLKEEFPMVKLHALGPPEIVHISNIEGCSYTETLTKLREAGLDSLPGGGAEILVNSIRKELSPVKCNADEWLAVMEAAHQIHMTTTATMMFGHIETVEHRMEHLIRVRETQDKRPLGADGFISFILWPFQAEGTLLQRRFNVKSDISSSEYIRMLSLSRIMLPNIKNIQASWLTVGKETAQACLHAGANDLGSVMIEENVVSAAGAKHKINTQTMPVAIAEAGFDAVLRDQQFNYIS